MAKNGKKMPFLAKNQVQLIFEVKYPLNHSGNPLNIILGQDTPSKHILWYIIPLSHAYVYLAWAPGPLCGVTTKVYWVTTKVYWGDHQSVLG